MSPKNPTAQQKKEIDKALKDLGVVSKKDRDALTQKDLRDAYDSVRILLNWITG